jgi:hypothetical protein
MRVFRLREVAKQQGRECSQLRSSIDSSNLLRSGAETVLSECGKQLVIAKKDLNLLIHCEEQTWDFRDMQTQLLNGSIYGIAKVYGLHSSIPKSHFPSVSNFKDTGIRSTFENYNSLLEGCEKYLRATVYQVKKQDLHSGSDPDANWLGKILAKREEVDPSLQLKAEMDCLPEFTSNIYNEEVNQNGLWSNFGDFS